MGSMSGLVRDRKLASVRKGTGNLAKSSVD